MIDFNDLPDLSMGWHQATTYPAAGTTILVEYVTRPAVVAIVEQQQPSSTYVRCRTQDGQPLKVCFASTAR